MEVFRRILLLRLHKAERLSESFMHNLFSAAPFPVSLLIPPGFLLPLRIEMLIKFSV